MAAPAVFCPDLRVALDIEQDLLKRMAGLRTERAEAGHRWKREHGVSHIRSRCPLAHSRAPSKGLKAGMAATPGDR